MFPEQTVCFVASVPGLPWGCPGYVLLLVTHRLPERPLECAFWDPGICSPLVFSLKKHAISRVFCLCPFLVRLWALWGQKVGSYFFYLCSLAQDSTRHFLMCRKSKEHSVSFWHCDIPETINLKRGKPYFGSLYQRFQFIVTAHIALGLWQQYMMGGAHGGEDCSLHGAWKQTHGGKGQGSYIPSRARTQ
jgi:hypothetical protein